MMFVEPPEFEALGRARSRHAANAPRLSLMLAQGQPTLS